MWYYYVHCGRMRQDRASISAPRHEVFSFLCNTKFSRWLISHAPSSNLTASLPLDSWYCSRNIVSLRFTSLAVFFTFQPVYYSTDPYPHNGGTFGIARWQARVPVLLSNCIRPDNYPWSVCAVFMRGRRCFLFLIVEIKISLFARGRWCNFTPSCPRWSRRCVPFEGHRAAHLTLILLTWRIGWAHNNARK